MLRFEEIIYFKICKIWSFRITIKSNAIDNQMNIIIIDYDNINKKFKNKGDDRKISPGV